MSALLINSRRQQWRLCLSAVRTHRFLTLSPSPPYLELTHEDLSKLPIAKFSGNCLVVSSLEDERRYSSAIDSLFNNSVLGFDTEWYNRRPRRLPSLVQLASQDVCILWRLCYQDQESLFVGEKLPPRLLHLLTSKKITKVGHASSHDAYLLLKHYYVNTCSVFDTYPMSRTLGLPMESLRGLAGMLLGVQISKAQAKTNWENRQLSESQLQYASTDAWISLEVYKSLMNYAVLQGVSPPPPVKSAFDFVPDPKERIYLGKKVKRAMMLRTELQRRAEQSGPPDKPADADTRSSSSSQLGILKRIKDVINQFLLKIEAAEQSAVSSTTLGDENSKNAFSSLLPYKRGEIEAYGFTHFEVCSVSEDTVSSKRQPVASTGNLSCNDRSWRASGTNNKNMAADKLDGPHAEAGIKTNRLRLSASDSLMIGTDWIDVGKARAENEIKETKTHNELIKGEHEHKESISRAQSVIESMSYSNLESECANNCQEMGDDVVNRDSEMESSQELADNLHVVAPS